MIAELEENSFENQSLAPNESKEEGRKGKAEDRKKDSGTKWKGRRTKRRVCRTGAMG